MHVVGHPKLGANWSVHNNLGQIVREIYHEFMSNPPTPAPVTTNSPATTAVGAGANPAPIDRQSTGHTTTATQPAPRTAPPQMEIAKTPPPLIPDRFAELEPLSTQDLEKLLNNPDLLQAMTESQESSVRLRKALDDILNTVEDQATRNLSKKSELQEQEATLSSLRTEIERQQTAVAALERRQAELAETRSFPAIMHLLDEAIVSADEESDEIKRRFESGTDEAGNVMDANQFAAKFLKARVLYHKRAAKRERLVDVFVHGNSLQRSHSEHTPALA